MALRRALLPVDGGPPPVHLDIPVRLLTPEEAAAARVAGPALAEPAGEAAVQPGSTPARPSAVTALGPIADGEHRFRTLIEQAADGIFVADITGRIVLANSRMCLLLGYDPAEILTLDVIDTYLPEEREVGRQFLAQLSVGTTFRFERMLMRKDGSAFPIEASVAWLPGGERQTIVRDMTARKRAEETLRMDERRLRGLVRLSELESASLPEVLDSALDEICGLVRSPFGFIAAWRDETGELAVSVWSRDVQAALGTLAGPTVLALGAAGLLGAAIRERRAVVLNQVPLDGAVECLAGYDRIVRFLSIPIRSRGRIVGVVGVGNKPADYGEVDVRQLTQMTDVVWKIAERQHAEDELRALNEVLEQRVAQRTAEFEAANARLEATNGELETANAQLQQLLREQESLQAELAYRALHDPLTGLGNRLLFAQRLEYAFEQSKRGVAVLWIDLDHFKQINDIFGHDVGDEVLLAVADRLRDVLRTTDDIARMGGDEFAIVLPNVQKADAQLVATRVHEALTDAGAIRLRVGASLGVSWAPPGTGDAKTLIRAADLAMYRAKADGGGLIVA